MAYIRSKMTDKGMYYLLLDEVQMLDCFESVLNGYLHKNNMDVYVTGSNARFWSKDIITEFARRGDEIHMYTLNFSEFMSVFQGELEDLLNILSFSIGSLTNPEKLKNTFRTVKKSKITSKYNRQFEQAHAMESVIYNEFRMRGYRVDVGVSLSPYSTISWFRTWSQFGYLCVHFFIIFSLARYNIFSSAVSLGNTLFVFVTFRFFWSL